MVTRTFDTQCLDHIETLRQRWGVKGISVALVLGPEYFGTDRRLEECYSFGVADDYGTPVSPDTMWSVGACGHAVIMLCIATLIDRKVLTLRAEPITYYSKMKDLLVDWKLQDEYATEHMDLVDVMEHRTGLPRHHFSRRNDESVDELVRRLRHLRPSCEPRYDIQFSEIHYDILQHVVTTMTGVPFAEYVKQQFLIPLGLQQSTYKLSEASNMGPPTRGFARHDYDQKELLRIWNDERRLDTASLGQPVPLEEQSCRVRQWNRELDDVKWAKAFMDSPLISGLWGRTTLKASYNYPMMFRQTNLHYEELGAWSYGLGMGISSYRGNYTGGDQGALPGHAARFAKLPNLSAHIFVAVNDGTHGEKIADFVTYYLYDVLLGLEPVDWEAKYLDRMVAMTPPQVTLPPYAEPSSLIKHVTGVYEDPRYGRLDLRQHDPANSGDSEMVAAIQKYVDRCSQAQMHWSGPILIAPLESTWASQLVLLPRDGDIWDCVVALAQRTDTGWGVVAAQHCKAVVTDEGIGMFEGFWGAGKQRYDRSASIAGAKERAEVWFSKL